MSPEESETFIADVLIGYWPTWKFTIAQTRAWVKKLARYDFNHAKRCVESLYTRWDKQGKPGAGQIFTALQPAVIKGPDAENKDPVLLYTIIRPDGRPAGHPVASPRGVPSDIEAVQKGADALRARVAGKREGYCVQWLCEAVAPSTPF